MRKTKHSLEIRMTEVSALANPMYSLTSASPKVLLAPTTTSQLVAGSYSGLSLRKTLYIGTVINKAYAYTPHGQRS